MQFQRVTPNSLYFEYRGPNISYLSDLQLAHSLTLPPLGKKIIIFLDMSYSMRHMKDLYRHIEIHLNKYEIYGFKDNNLCSQGCLQNFEGLSNLDPVINKCESLNASPSQIDQQYWIVVVSDGEFNMGSNKNITQLRQSLKFKFIGIGLRPFQSILSEFDFYYHHEHLDFTQLKPILDSIINEYQTTHSARFTFSFQFLDTAQITPSSALVKWLLKPEITILSTPYQNQITFDFPFTSGQITVRHFNLHRQETVIDEYIFTYQLVPEINRSLALIEKLQDQVIYENLRQQLIQYFRKYHHWLPVQFCDQIPILLTIQKLNSPSKQQDILKLLTNI